MMKSKYTHCPTCGFELLPDKTCEHCGVSYPVLINLTPHKLTIFDSRGEKIIREIEPSGTVARCTPTQTITGEIAGVPVVSTELSDVENLPDLQAGTVYVVSSLVAQAVSERNDVVAPDTGPESVIRDDDGRIIGVRRFQRFGDSDNDAQAVRRLKHA